MTRQEKVRLREIADRLEYELTDAVGNPEFNMLEHGGIIRRLGAEVLRIRRMVR